MKIKYELFKVELEVEARDFKPENMGSYYYKEQYFDGSEPETIGMFDTHEEAKAAKPADDFWGIAAVRIVTEYHIQKVEWNEDFEEWEYVENYD